MLRFALFSPPDEGPPLFKGHHLCEPRVVSQDGDYRIYYVCSFCPLTLIRKEGGA